MLTPFLGYQKYQEFIRPKNIDPYETLSVSPTATVTQIKTAYKKLAKEWHPDKNSDAGAEDKFVEINKAYQLLTDPARREEFDRHGTTEDKPNFRNYPNFKTFQFDFFSNPTTKSMPGSIFFKYTISSKQYYNKVLPGSSNKPFLIVFYSGFCIPCIEVEYLWKVVAEDFQPLGIGVACIHADYEKKLVRKLGVDKVPYIIGVINGQVKHIRNSPFSLKKVITFTKEMFPAHTIDRINKEPTLKLFLNGWNQNNKICVVICSQLESIRLRFYATAFKFRDEAVFSYVQLGQDGTEFLSTLYGINKLHTESLLVFHEDGTTPVASLSMSELSVQAMDDVIEANKFLLLPRLSSQRKFDSLCPPEAAKARKHLCVVLLTQKSSDHERYREAMRDYLHSHRFNKARVRFAYIFEESQKEFVQALSEGKEMNEASTPQIVIIWRRDLSNIKYQWLKEGWNIQAEKFNSSQEALEVTIKQLLRTSEALPYNAVLKELTDEHGLNIFSRIAKKVLLFVDSLQDKISNETVLPVLSVILTFGFILLVGFGMTYLLKIEEEALNQKYDKCKKNGFLPKEKPIEPSLKIHELRGETYFGLLRLLKPGFRTIILLLDNQSKNVVMPKFFKAVFPYRKNKSLMFAFLNLDRNLDWYRALLIQALASPRELNINPKNCIGTVLSINGQRKYFCMFHPKHPEKPRGDIQNVINSNNGKFLGFDDSESENSDVESGKTEDNLLKDDSLSSVLFEENLLDNLPSWLDRLFEGSTKRYYFQVWPNLKC
ncbi:DnaJ subfamily C member 16 [Nymphon striatum]|nr:DnaJ subfamily C member 16 [Nymphon striatum]